MWGLKKIGSGLLQGTNGLGVELLRVGTTPIGAKRDLGEVVGTEREKGIERERKRYGERQGWR